MSSSSHSACVLAATDCQLTNKFNQLKCGVDLQACVLTYRVSGKLKNNMRNRMTPKRKSMNGNRLAGVMCPVVLTLLVS